MVISQIPALTAHYSESSTFGRPGLGRSDPNIRWQFHRFLWNSYFIPTLRAEHLADQVLADLPPSSNSNFTDSCSTLKAHICQTKCWQINPPPTNTLRAHAAPAFGRPFHRCVYGISHLADLQIPPEWQFQDSCSDNFRFYSDSSLADQALWFQDFSYISFLLPESSTLKAHIWQTRSWQMYPPTISGNFTDSYSDNSYFHSYSESSTFGRPGLSFGRPGLGISTPPSNGANFIDSYSDNSYFIPTLRAYHLAYQVLAYLLPIQWFHRFLLWQLSTLRAQHLADQV